MGSRQLIIGQQLLRQVLEHCIEEKPYEACGILAGSEDGQVLHAYATDNLRHSPVLYEVEPLQQAAALRELSGRGDELLAIYHSHPSTSAYPSETDIRMAVHYPGVIRVIISLAGGPADVRAYLIDRDHVREVPVQTATGGAGQWHDMREAVGREDQAQGAG